MADYTLPPANTLIVGMTGSGKTTFALRYLQHAPAACRFIFDDLGRAATRLGITPAYTAKECEAALSSRWVVFNPSRAFPGDYASAFRWFCHWCYLVSCRAPGKKFVHIDEVWQWQTNQGIPKELAMIAQTGREEHMELVLCTQMPHKVHASVTGQSTELVVFRLQEPLAVARAVELSSGKLTRERIETLPPGEWLAINRQTGGQLSGRVF